MGTGISMHRIFIVTALCLFAFTGCPEATPIDTEESKTLETKVAAAVCGDGDLTGEEVCDDGNDSDEDACTNACTPATCGDGISRTDITAGEEGYEECDDGDDENNDSCTPICVAAVCGDGILRIDLVPGQEGYEACDDGNDNQDDECTSLCQPPVCGDGFTQLGLEETCDDGNEANDDACTNSCLDAFCGDGIARIDLEEGEEGFEYCDDGNAIDVDECSNTCTYPKCGDGIVQAGEQCDDGNGVDDDRCSNTCIAAPMNEGVINLSSGQHHTCALYATGEVKCWGLNNMGQAGADTDIEYVVTPVLIGGLPPVVEISLGSQHSCARTDSGDLWCWGVHDRGQLGCGGEVILPTCGQNDRACTPTPQQVLLDQPATQVSAGSVHTCAILEDGTLMCWGPNHLCQLGTGGLCGEEVIEEVHFEPILVEGVDNAHYVSSGGFFTCVVVGQAKTVKCWGSSVLLSTGVLGNGTDNSINEPVDVSTLSNVDSLATGVGHACARQGLGNVWCWGGNGMGQLGLGEDEVTEIFGGVNEPALTIANTEYIGTGDYHSCVILNNYTMRCWGMNMYGQVGTGQLPPGGQGPDQTLFPDAVVAMAGAYRAAGGEGHTCSLRYDGKVFCWGDNQYNQCAHENEEMSMLPVEILGL